jgi:hypothetical protein
MQVAHSFPTGRCQLLPACVGIILLLTGALLPLPLQVLERRVVKKGKTYVVPLADKEVDFTDTFRLFCTTRLPNPHFTPELSAKVGPGAVFTFLQNACSRT